MDGTSLTEINGIVAESAEQDQTARMCSLILLYTLREINLWAGCWLILCIYWNTQRRYLCKEMLLSVFKKYFPEFLSSVRGRQKPEVFRLSA